MEDDVDSHWDYVRKDMGAKFKRYHNSLKTKFIKNEKYEENWQRMCGMPSNVKAESFAYLLLHWGSKYAQVIHLTRINSKFFYLLYIYVYIS